MKEILLFRSFTRDQLEYVKGVVSMWTQNFFALIGIIVAIYLVKNRVPKLQYVALAALGGFIIGSYIGGGIAKSFTDNVPVDWRYIESRKIASLREVKGSPRPGESTFYIKYKDGRSSVPDAISTTEAIIYLVPEDEKNYTELLIFESYPIGFSEKFVFFDSELFYEFRVPVKDMPKGIEFS